jgi:hypothetical protein
MPLDRGTRGTDAARKPPPKKKRRRVDPVVKAAAANTSTFTPPALVPPPPIRNPDHRKVPGTKPKFRLEETPKQARDRQVRETRLTVKERAALADLAPVSRDARIRLREKETPTERKIRTGTIPPPRKPRSTRDNVMGVLGLVDDPINWVAGKAESVFDKRVKMGPGRSEPYSGIGAVDTMVALGEGIHGTGREISKGADALAERGVQPLTNLFEPVVDIINRGIAGYLTVQAAGNAGFTQDAPSPKASGLVPPEVAQNFATGLAQTIAGAPAGAIMLVTDPGRVWEETKAQYAQYYGPALRGDWKQFQRNLEEQPVQIVFDVWAALAIGAGASVRATALGRTLKATPEQLANIPRAAAIAQSILFRKQPYSIPGVGEVFGRKPTIRYENFETEAGQRARVQRMVPQSAIGVAVSDRLEALRATRGGSKRRGEKLIREELEQRQVRSRAELATFARRVSTYSPSVLDGAARLIGITGSGRKGRAARELESNRLVAARALAVALDRAGIHGGSLYDVVEKIDTEIEVRQNRVLETGAPHQIRRVRDLINARTLLARYIEDPDSADAVAFLDDLEATRQLANDTEQRLIEIGLLRPDTAANLIDRQTRDVERLEQVQSESRDRLEDALYARWAGSPNVDERVATALHLLDAQALSYERRTGNDPGQLYDDLIKTVTVSDVMPEGALLQIRDFDYALDPAEAQRNLRSKLNPRNAKKGAQRNKAVRRKGLVVVGRVTPREWVKRVEAMYPEPSDRDLMARWYETFEPLFRETFGDHADTLMRGFAVSQANASPTFGVEATLKVMDKVRRGEEVRPDEISVVVKGIEAAVKGERIEKGMAAKLRDFSDSLAGKTTRTHMGDDPDGGPPVAVDVHALRDLGYVDPKIVRRLDSIWGLKEGVHYEIDSTGRADGPMYERAAEQYVAITDHLNEIAFDGRTDWIPAQVQALGWGTAQKMLGVDPEDLGYALGRNTRSIDFEYTDGPEGLGVGLTMEQIQAVGREMEASARDLVESHEGVWLRGVEHGVGGWGGMVTPSMHVKVIGSREEVAALTSRFATAFRQHLVQASREVTGRNSRAAVVIASPSFADDTVKAAFFKRLNEVEPRLEGFMPDSIGDTPAITIRTGSGSVSKATANEWLGRWRDAVERVEEELGLEVDLGVKNVELLIGDQYGLVDRLSTEGRDRWAAGDVDDPVARAVGERLADAIARAGAGAGADAPRVTPRILSKGEAWDMPPTPGFVYHGTSEGGAESILKDRVVKVGTERQPEAAWFTSNPGMAAFHGDVVLEFPESVLPPNTRTMALGAIASPEDVYFQWDYARFYDTEPREPRGGALVREDGTEIILGPAADLTTVVHEAAHAFLPEQLGWVADYDPEWADRIAKRLKMDGDVIDERAQEIFAYSVEAWAAMGRPTVTQLRERWQHYAKESRQAYRGRTKIPEEYRQFVDEALMDPEYTAWIADLWDPLWGMQAKEGAFFISRRTPLSRNPLDRLRQKSGLSKPRDRVRERTGILEEQARDVPGPTNVLENAERWQRYVEQQEKLEMIRTSGWATPIPIVDGFYDFAAKPPGHSVFNPDGLRGWTRHENEADARMWESLEASPSLDDADLDLLPVELAERIHGAALDIGNRVFPETGFDADPSAGTLYFIPNWVKEAYVRDMSGALLNRQVLGRGLSKVADVLKTLNALQRLRMYIALRYIVLNVGATGTLNTMHQGLFMPMNLGRAVRMAHGNPDLLGRLEAEVGSGFFEALTLGELSRGAPTAAQLIERTASAVGTAVSRPEAFLRSTSIIHHMRRAGLRTEQQMLALLDAAKTNEASRAYLNQIARYAEEDVVRFRGLPPAERDMLRAVFFVSGWLVSASRFTLRYPANHPFWTTMLAQLGDDGWEEMRRRIAEWAQPTKYSLEIGEGVTPEGIEYSDQTDIGQWLPFATASDMVGTGLQLLGLAESERKWTENFGTGARLVWAGLTRESIYGEPYSWSTAADDFMIANTPLDYVADYFPGAFRWFNHERTPSKLRVDQTAERYTKELIFGRAYPTRYVRDEIVERWERMSEESGMRAQRRVQAWANEIETYFGSPPDETSVAAKAALYENQSLWRQAQGDLDEADEEEKLLEQARIKATTMRKYGFVPEDEVFDAPTVEELHAVVEATWDATVGAVNDAANDAYRIPDGP